MRVVAEQGKALGVAALCAALSMPRATFYRQQRPAAPKAARRKPPRTLDDAERAAVLAVLNEARFEDLSPGEVYATLLDEGTYLCSRRTMYRVLAENDEVRERRDQLAHPKYAAPQLLATKPNELWSWDITKLHGPAKWSYFYLYVILDVFSRYVVGWMIANRETAVLAEKLISETCVRQGISRDQLTIHADRGSPMKSKAVAFLLADLGIVKSHSRPHVSNDNPFSEAHFKTLKYRPDFPERFGCIEDSRAFGRDFFRWYNDEHHHAGIGMLTPHDVHHGLASQRVVARDRVLLGAFTAHPERFTNGPPRPHELPSAVWINKPTSPPAQPPRDDFTPANPGQ